METVERKRLDSLDGLRGIAIILVLLNHIDSQFITGYFPKFFQPIIGTLFTSGLNVGVAFLFILSGYLMAYIYAEPKNNLGFLQKRYTRIFPLFITMVLAMATIKNVPTLSPLMRLGLVLSLATSVHLLWVYVVKRLDSPALSRGIFIGFLFLQVAAAGLYALVIMRQPAMVFNQIIPGYLRESAIALINATLTLPFGDYVPMLDGVYWTLVCEVLFYILYPILYVPFVRVFAKQNRASWLLFFASLLPLFAALSLISHNILRFSMLKLPFFMYFATGVALGHISKHHESKLHSITNRFSSLINPISFLIIIILMRLSLSNVSIHYYDWIVMLWAFPLTFLVGVLLNDDNSLTKLFKSKSLIYLGTISYSIYLSHTGVVDALHTVFRPFNVASNLYFVSLAVITTLILSTLLHHLLEKPYFMKLATTSDEKFSSHISFPRVSFAVLFILILGIFTAYQSSFNFTSLEKTYGRAVISNPKVSSNIGSLSLEAYPYVDLQFTSPEDKLGIVTANLKYNFLSEKKNSSDSPAQELIFQIKPSGSKDWYATSTYVPNEIGESPMHPFGFPLIEDAKGKKFDIRLQLLNLSAKESIDLHFEDGVVMRSVHQVGKRELLTNPQKLFSLIYYRLRNVATNSEAQIVVLYMLPFTLFLVGLNQKV